MQSLKGRSFLAVKEFTPSELRLMINTARQFKSNKYAGVPNRMHEGKSVALLFEKTSTRTRCAFTVAAIDLGIHPEYLGKDDIQLGKKESVADTAKVLGRMFDGIQFRGFAHSTVEDLAANAGVPVWNGLTDSYHPTQMLADFMTIEESLGFIKGARLAYVGDGRNNIATSLAFMSALMGVDFRIGTPKELFIDPAELKQAQALADKYKTGAKITVTEDVKQAVDGVDFVYTDVWVSMGEEDKFAERIALLKDYQVNADLMKASGNPDVKFLHCLPAFHDTKTTFGQQVKKDHGLDSMEVSDEVFQSVANISFDQAENRLYTIEAVMALTL